MKKKITAVENYAFQSSDQLFLDANIWFFLYGPPSNTKYKVRVYSEAFKKILEAKCQIFIDALIVSEFINRYARIKQQLIAPGTDFKEFRRSKEFKNVASSIADDVSCVLEHCCQIESGFEVVKMDKLLQEYSEGNSDFNDQIVTALCSNQDLILLTDDGDFRGQSIQILTANSELLK